MGADGRWRDSVSVGGSGRSYTRKTFFLGGYGAVGQVSISMRERNCTGSVNTICNSSQEAEERIGVCVEARGWRMAVGMVLSSSKGTRTEASSFI